MKTYGLIGYPLSHSFSKKYFTEKFISEGIKDHQYELFPIENIKSLPDLLVATPSLCGLNVTIPHKVNVLCYLNEIEEAAEKIGAVNCISIKNFDGETYLKGYNTDAYGFEASLKPLLKSQHTKALVFGDGGAAKAVKYVLEKLGIEYLVVVRKPTPKAILYSEISSEILKRHKLLINTTPLGMLPNVNTHPEIDYSILNDEYLAYDLVYNPLETAFLTKAKLQGADVKNGLEMLYKQAEKAWCIWNNIG
ncbi:shikimate dehydrogenase [Pedobacter sp. Leaf194]|uniref:shikimate dehydrogenase family protein n=1 Tax=Pedobacter sp. Leaf194 TaxID=1736297 RepID=UPI0007025AB8|nr:shikimate dehydrogenase [Pedobacter sp. Leaf194]KQS31686.1 shikimate dehydrogenase [Pedobacter sp. Leaf194]RZL36976.1 MAG: shikimate dehydrogenase [Pedobacter sp.]